MTSRILVLAALLVSTLIPISRIEAAEADDAGDVQMPKLADLPVSLPAGAAEAVLPVGAVLHVRLSQLATLLDHIDGLVMGFVPEQAVPKPMRKYLGQPKPLLAWLGDQTVGGPLTPAAISERFGIAADRPLTVTWYADDLPRSWVLSLPIGHDESLAALLMNTLRPRSCESCAIGAQKGWHIAGTNQDLPGECFAARSQDTLFLFGSMRTATSAVAGGAKHLSDDPLIAGLPASDLCVAASALPVKPMIAMMAKQFGTIPPGAIKQWRAQFLRMIPPDALGNLNFQLRWRAGIADVNQLLDYAECLVTASAETFVPTIASSLMGIDGLALGIDLRPEQVKVRLAIAAAGVETFASSPLPLAEVRAAAASLPGERLMLSASGRAAPPKKSEMIAAWGTNLAQKLKAKDLPGGLLVAMATFWRDAKPPLELDAEVPWMLSSACQPEPAAAGAEATSLADYAESLKARMVVAPELVAFPKQADGFLEKHLAARAAAGNGNEELFNRLMREVGHDDRWIDTVSRFHAEPRAGKPTKLVYENAYVTRTGILSYSQHELVNRTIWYGDVRGPLQLLQRVQGDHLSWLDDAAPAAKPLPAAIAKLFDQVEDGSDSLQMARVLPLLPRVVEELARVERVAHAEIDAYLEQAIAVINRNQGKQEQMVAELSKLGMPMQVASLNINQDHLLYCVLPGNLRYPRPLVVPILQRLLAGFTAKADEAGGMLVTTKAAPGRYTVTVVQDLRALALLVKSTGNAVFNEFLGKPDPTKTLRDAVSAVGDGEPNEQGEVILYNLLWPRPRARGRSAAAF